MKRDEIVEEALTWVGTKWVHQGRTRNGVDCVGLLCKVADKFNMYYEDKTNYSRNPNGFEFLEQLRKFFPPARVNQNPHGLIAIMRENVYPCHTGIIYMKDGRRRLIHATAVDRACVDEDFELSGMAAKFVECRMFAGMED